MEVFNEIRERLEKVSEIMELSSCELDVLLKHEKISSAKLLVNGKKYDAWRIIHNNALGPGKGGIRFHPDVSEDEVMSLSFWMSLKTALLGLPLGGAKGGVKVNPKELNSEELEELSRAYAKAFAEVIGANKDIPAPDVYTNSQIMAWILDEYEKIKGHSELGVITGKPVELGGLVLRGDATSKGGFIVLKEFLKRVENIGNNENDNEISSEVRESESIKNEGESSLIEESSQKAQKLEDTKINKYNKQDLKIAIQGFGNAGMHVAKMLYSEGFKINSVSDSKGGIYSEEGLDVEKVIEVKKEKGSVQDFESDDKISNSELLELDVDLLILAALENQITSENADNVKAKYILELANGPVSHDADKKLHEKGIVVIPDILANAGGVVVSYFEWLQNKIGNILEEDYLSKKLEDKMIKSFNEVWDLYEENKDKLDMRGAAYVIALKRILEGERLRGRLKKKNIEHIEEIDWSGNAVAKHPKEKLKEKMFPHKVSVVIPRGKDGKFVLCRRAKDQEPFPGVWCCAVGGKALAGESEENAALREMKEEIGKEFEIVKVTSVKYDEDDYKGLFGVFTTKEPISHNELDLDPKEIQYTKEFLIEEIEKMVEENPEEFAPTFREIIKEFVKEID